MLYDNLNNITRYHGLYKGLDVVIEWLESHKLEELPMGRTDLLGDKVFVNVMEQEPREEEGVPYEVHQKYMDLQLDLIGHENFRVCSGAFTWTKPYNPDTDCGLGVGASSCKGQLGDNTFALFLADEPHMPTLKADTAMVKKAVFKILRDELF